MPARALARGVGVRRYGFHGMAHRYLCQNARRLAVDRPAARIVSLQLGRGCSVTATADGRPIATSMGFTPLEGLVMGTRSGESTRERCSTSWSAPACRPPTCAASSMSSAACSGISDRTADMRDLLGLERVGSAAAALAIEVFCRRASAVPRGLRRGAVGGRCDRLRRRHRRERPGHPTPHPRPVRLVGHRARPGRQCGRRRQRGGHRPPRAARRF